MSKSLLIFLLTLMLSSVVLSQELDHQYFQNNIEVYFKFRFTSKNDLNELSRMISIDNVKGDTAFAYANEEQYNNFIKSGYEIKILTAPGKLIVPRMSDDPQSILDWNIYPTYDAYIAMMNQFASDHPDICQLVNAGSTVQGREILFVKISDNVNQREAEPQLMLSSSMHGDEITGYVLMLRLIDTLLTSYGTDTRLTNLINNDEIWINPLANPDGTYHGGNSTVYGATRYNVNGVDLNRNFPDPAAGPHPDGHAWQPETITMKTLAEENHFVLSVNFHGGAEVVNYPWDTWSRLHPDDTWWQMISHLYADTAQANSPAGYMSGFNDGITNGYAWYRVTGGRQDFFTYFHHGREVTIEISNTKTPNASLLPAYWYYNKESFLDFMENTYYGVRGIVTDTLGNPVKAKIEIASHDFDNSEVYSDSLTGAYYRMIAAGTYTITFSAENYFSQTINDVQVIDFQSTELNIQLVPTPTPVELVSFTAVNKENGIELIWNTSTETNNRGFEVQRSEIGNQGSKWEKIGFTKGNGTTTLNHNYSYIDENLAPGKYLYRLKQIDFSGSFEYSDIVEAEVNTPGQFVLEQNYPNPFNPATSIEYRVPVNGFVSLKVYDALGNEVASLVNEEKQAGNYLVNFEGRNLSS
ncbi:MAG TPA: M14 family zinc carboxypeptidase, partial [Ignavibacteriaceae bacterium]